MLIKVTISMMPAYFQLQRRMISRHWAAMGLSPILGYLLAVIAFVGFSFLLFYKLENASYLYVVIALVYAARLGEKRRNDFLKMTFRKGDYQKVRFLENGILVLPFVLFLGFKMQILVAIILIAAALSLSLVSWKRSFGQTIPTPFSKYPFEFVVGFRKVFLLIGLAYFLTVMSVMVDNFNLGAFSLVLVMMISWSFYGEPEDEYSVWVFQDQPRAFLWNKVKVFVRYSFVLAVPILLVLGYYFFAQANILMLVMAWGWIVSVVVILSKYAAFPGKLSIPDGFLVVLSIFVPPILLVTIPFFYKKSIRQLYKFLG